MKATVHKFLAIPLAVVVVAILAHAIDNQVSAAEPKSPMGGNQISALSGLAPHAGYPGIPPLPGHFALSKAQLAEFVQSVVKAIGTTGDARHKLGFAVGPFCFDMSDEETRQ